MTKKRFFCIDGHTCGCPVRVVAGGGPLLSGRNMLEKRQHFLNEFDWIRTGLMFEPRGHDMMSGSILYPPHDPENDVSILDIETSGCLAMCGHGTIGTVTIAIEEGLVTPKTPGQLRLETPAGLVLVKYEHGQGQRVRSVRFTNVPSFLHANDLKVVSPQLGTLLVDVAYGGNFYGIIEPQANFSGIDDFSAAELIRIGCDLRTRLNDAYHFEHPLQPQINTLTHIQFVDSPRIPTANGRNAVLVGNNALDRSPCGTGTSARMAQLFHKGLLNVGDRFIHESYIGSCFTGFVDATTEVNNTPAIIPVIEGWAHITGYNNIVIDTDDDPYAAGFQVL